MLRTPLKGALKMTNSELYNLSTPLLIRSKTAILLTPDYHTKLHYLCLYLKKISKKKKKDFYTLVLISGQLLQNVKNKSPCVCYLLSFWPILDFFYLKTCDLMSNISLFFQIFILA